MATRQAQYEELLAAYSNVSGAIELLKQHRPYLEMLPSLRRPGDSIIPIPLPIIKLRGLKAMEQPAGDEVVRLPCDLAILMCDPEWKVKTGVEIFVFIHHDDEDFSHLLSRWRQTQVWLSRGYEWDMPLPHRHVLNEGADKPYPLFIVFDDTLDRIKRGLKGAFLPYVTQPVQVESEVTPPSILLTEAEALQADDPDR